ncbi:8-amino-7-oxononanoate synthase (pimeloyl-CoA-dependent) [Kyrpidia spormannii]|uniref:8-amino-7-oxononanoate synthase (Pimeloyl-CoA-dependent) n=1 Tax=Kyrpidia spormannii TaxID=2055160 RepID=A0ACA8ZBV3_9BACL|nr:8-amino-7-oxononanoate synthase (pimeloyl-CoA-dependent) [Kyrpidia spormannii]
MMDSTGLEAELQNLEDAGLRRRLRRVESAPGPEVTVEGRRMLMCASNNYLGLAQDPRLIEAAHRAMIRYGAGSTGSRLISGDTELHEALEKRIARWKGTEAALVFATGYMANVALATTLAGEQDVIFSDEWNHASIIDGCRLSRARVSVYRHADPGDLESKIIAAGPARRRLIYTDGVFSMDGDVAPLPGLLEVAGKYDAFVVVDDAHAGGVLGKRGRGTMEYYGLSPAPRIIQMGTLSKAAGVEGAYVAGAKAVIDYLINRARPFIFSTAPSPAAVGAALAAVEIMEQEQWRRDHLRALASRLRTGLRERGWRVPEGSTPIIPVIIGEVGETLRLAARLDDAGIFAPAIRPPTVPPESCRIRLTVTAAHRMEDVDRILAVFATEG